MFYSHRWTFYFHCELHFVFQLSVLENGEQSRKHFVRGEITEPWRRWTSILAIRPSSHTLASAQPIQTVNMFCSIGKYVCYIYKFRWGRWGSSLTGLRTLDPPLGPTSTLANMWNTCKLSEEIKPELQPFGVSICSDHQCKEVLHHRQTWSLRNFWNYWAAS